MLQACKNRNIEGVKQALRVSPASIASQGSKGKTALHVACSLPSLELTKLLLDNKADVNTQDTDGWTPFHVVAKSSILELCALFLLGGSSPNSLLQMLGSESMLEALAYIVTDYERREYVFTWHFAKQNRKGKRTDSLRREGSRLSVRSSAVVAEEGEKQTAAISSDATDAADASTAALDTLLGLLEAEEDSAEESGCDEEPAGVDDASGAGTRSEPVELGKASSGVAPAAGDELGKGKASSSIEENESEQDVEVKLRKGNRLRKRRKKSRSIARLKINSINRTTLKEKARQLKKVVTMDTFADVAGVDLRKDISQVIDTLASLIYCETYYGPEAVRTDIQNKQGLTALAYLVRLTKNGLDDLVPLSERERTSLSAGQLGKPSAEEQLSIWQRAEKPSPRTVTELRQQRIIYRLLLEVLLTKGTEMRVTSHYGDTLLHFAAFANNPIAIRYLMKNGVDVNALNSQNETPLHYAVRARSHLAVKILLDHGGGVYLRSARGETPVDLAKTHNDSELLSLMEDKRVQSESNVGAVVTRQDRVTDAFEKLLDVEVPKNKKKSALTAFYSEVESHLEWMVVAQYDELVPADQVDWLLFLRARLTIKRTVLSKEESAKLLEVMSYFQTHAAQRMQAAKDGHMMTLLDYGLSLAEYLSTHRIDPESIIIGLQLDDNVLCTESIPLWDLRSALKVLSNSLPWYKDTQEIESTFTGTLYPTLDLPILSSLLECLESMEVEEAGKFAKAMATLKAMEKKVSALWKDRELRKGDVCVALVNSSQHKYVRFTGIQVGQPPGVSLRMTSDSLTKGTIDINAHLVVPLSEAVENKLWNVKTMIHIVHGPIKQLYRTILSAVNTSSTGILVNKNVDVDLLYRCAAMDVVIENSQAIQETKKELQSLLENFDKEFADFLAGCRAYLMDRYISLATDVDTLQESFLPMRDEQLKGLLEVPVDLLTKQRLQRFIAYCDTALGHIKILKLQVVDGTKKKEIVDWWLRLIRNEQHIFLEKIGYDMNAVPKNYIEEAPSSLDIVKRNLAVIQEVLDRREDKHGLGDLIEQLKKEIYPRIDEFIDNAICAISDYLGAGTSHFSLRYCSMLMSQRQDELDPQIWARLEGLFKDLIYLYTIKELEENPEKMKGKLSAKDQNVVPISGLVVNYFYRLENELKTVLEVWEGNAASSSSPPPSQDCEEEDDVDEATKRAERMASWKSIRKPSLKRPPSQSGLLTTPRARINLGGRMAVEFETPGEEQDKGDTPSTGEVDTGSATP